jgi:hypothetical protein
VFPEFDPARYQSIENAHPSANAIAAETIWRERDMKPSASIVATATP